MENNFSPFLKLRPSQGGGGGGVGGEGGGGVGGEGRKNPMKVQWIIPKFRVFCRKWGKELRTKRWYRTKMGFRYQ